MRKIDAKTKKKSFNHIYTDKMPVSSIKGLKKSDSAVTKDSRKGNTAASSYGTRESARE